MSPDLDFSHRTVMESSYCGGQAAALLPEQTCLPFFPFPSWIVFRIAA